MSLVEGGVAVITGAASGIGRSLVSACATEGMRVVAADIESDALHEAVAPLADRAQIRSVVTDVSDEKSVRALADATWDAFGACHLLCNNAGVFQGGTLWERSTQDWEWVLGVNVWGLIHGVNAFVPRMIADGEAGHVVNTASMAGLAAAPFSAPYQASKFAAFGLSVSLAQDLEATGLEISASVLCPGPVDTAIGSSDRNRPEALTTPQGDDVAFVESALRDMTDNHGDSPDAVADLVLDAVRNNQFFIPTRPEFADQLRVHTEAIIARRLPPIPEFF